MNVRLEGLAKAFGGVPALQGAGFALGPGEILGLVGENGAGKSTLMNVLAGAIRPDQGRMWIDGQPYEPRSPVDARRAGIAFVHQELTLFPNLTVAENLQLVNLPRRGGLPWIDRAASTSRARAALNRVGLHVPPDTPLDRLGAGERQLVEIARALDAHARLLILDEPTTSLGVAERSRLLELMATLRRQGLAQVFISHDLDDVRRACDRIVVLRDGRVVGEGADFDGDALVALMIGRAARGPGAGARTLRERAASPAEGIAPRLQVRGLADPGVVRDISLSVAAGEIVGLFGLMGAGRTELLRRIFGLDPVSAGEVIVDGVAVTGGPRARMALGLGLVTEDRRTDGLCLQASIADNLTLAALPGYVRAGGLLDGRAMAAGVRTAREAMGVTPQARDDRPAGTLSGGNQQKVVLGKWLLTAPRVLLLDEPTRGIDVGARAEIHDRLRDLAAGGAALLVVSSDLEELVALADRVLVLRRGAISGEFPGPSRSPGADGRVLREAILRAALPEAVR
jgi:ABC-type sugar transport system ATPase subunit